MTRDQFTGHCFHHYPGAGQCPYQYGWSRRALDNIFIGTVLAYSLHEDIYLKEYADVPGLYDGLTRYMQFYNHERRHQSLKNCTPAQVYFGR